MADAAGPSDHVENVTTWSGKVSRLSGELADHQGDDVERAKLKLELAEARYELAQAEHMVAKAAYGAKVTAYEAKVTAYDDAVAAYQAAQDEGAKAEAEKAMELAEKAMDRAEKAMERAEQAIDRAEKAKADAKEAIDRAEKAKADAIRAKAEAELATAIAKAEVAADAKKSDLDSLVKKVQNHVFSSPSTVSNNVVEEKVGLGKLSPASHPVFLRVLADLGLLTDEDSTLPSIDDMPDLRAHDALAACIKARVGALAEDNVGLGAEELELTNSEVAFTGLAAAGVSEGIADLDWACLVNEAATCAKSNSRGAPADMVIYAALSESQGDSRLRPAVVIELGTSKKGAQVAAYAVNLAHMHRNEGYEVPMLTIEGSHQTPGVLTLCGVVVPTLKHWGDGAKVLTTVPLAEIEYSSRDDLCDALAQLITASLSAVRWNTNINARPAVIRAGPNVSLVLSSLPEGSGLDGWAYKWFRPEGATSSRRINLDYWQEYSPAAEAKMVSGTRGRVLITKMANLAETTRIGHFVSLLGTLGKLHAGGVVHGDILLRNVAFIEGVSVSRSALIDEARAALDEDPPALERALVAAIEARVDVSGVVVGDASTLTAALDGSVTGPSSSNDTVMVYRALLLDYDLARHIDEDPRPTYPIGFVSDDVQDGKRASSAYAGQRMACVHDAVAFQGLMECMTPEGGAQSFWNDSKWEEHPFRTAASAVVKDDGLSAWRIETLVLLSSMGVETALTVGEAAAQPNKAGTSSPPSSP